jgi:hypothetical protein
MFSARSVRQRQADRGVLNTRTPEVFERSLEEAHDAFAVSYRASCKESDA